MRTFALFALVAGCTSIGGATFDMSRPSVPCGVELSEPFALSAVKMDNDGVTCSSPATDGFAAWAASTGPLALLRVDGDRVSLVTHVGDQVQACDEWQGTVDEMPGRAWAYDLALEGCGMRLAGTLFGSD